jgi:hypothetical protein
MWRSGAPQRREARGAFRGAEAHTRSYTPLRHWIYLHFLFSVGINEMFRGSVSAFVKT